MYQICKLENSMNSGDKSLGFTSIYPNNTDVYMDVSVNGGTPISHPKCWSFLVGVYPWVCWGFTHHCRTPPHILLVYVAPCFITLMINVCICSKLCMSFQMRLFNWNHRTISSLYRGVMLIYQSTWSHQWTINQSPLKKINMNIQQIFQQSLRI